MEEDKEFHTFFKGISPKVNVIEQVGFELTYWDYSVALQDFSHYARENSQPNSVEYITK